MGRGLCYAIIVVPSLSPAGQDLEAATAEMNRKAIERQGALDAATMAHKQMQTVVKKTGGVLHRLEGGLRSVVMARDAEAKKQRECEAT